MILLVLSAKMIFLFPEIMILLFRQKMKDHLSRKKKIIKKKDNENMTFSVYSVKMVFLFSTNMMLPFFKKAKITFSRKIHLKMTFFVSLEKIVFILDNMVFQILICNNKCALFNL